jgi:hypothetical protein
MGLELTDFTLDTPVDLYSRGTFPGLLFVPEALNKNICTTGLDSTHCPLCLQGVAPKPSIKARLDDPPHICISKPKWLKWLLAVDSPASACEEVWGTVLRQLGLELMTTTTILVAPPKHFSWCP